MNFFESQDRVRKNTFQLVLLFGLAVVTLIIMVNLLIMVVFGYINSQQLQDGETLLQQMDWQTFAAVSVGVGVVVLAGSLYKIIVLSAGGKVVAESLGGKLVPQNTDDLKQRKLLNVVEEMAIACGTPVPPVYLLVDEQGINAFAAGFSPRDAVIGVTQGAIDHLSREQLQGVIAHEFSHIFNGDMRLNIRLIGVLNGILILGIIGYYLLYSTSYSRRVRSSGKNAGGIQALAIGLMIIGFAGTFFGGLIKAAVSRQREYLADASAVQFTRNPDGIAGALKRIGGLEFGSKVENPSAPELSHAFFAQGVSGFMQAMAATHPPLAKRILRIDPDWDGKFLSSDLPDKTSVHREEKEVSKSETIAREALAKNMAVVVTGAAVADVSDAMNQIGNPKQETINHARSLIAALPSIIIEAAHEPYGARAVIYSLLLDSAADIHNRQLAYLQSYADADVLELIHRLMPATAGLNIKYRLPLIDIAIPALKQLSLDQYQSFRANMVALIEMDSRVDMLEWSLQKILFTHLDGQFFKLVHTKMRYAHVGQLRQEVALLLSVMAYAGQQDKNELEEAFSAATKILEIGGLQLVRKDNISLAALDQSLGKLEELKPLAKSQLLKACAASVVRDQNITAVEVELLRAFSDVLGCPMPTVIL
ncbi:M48 family metallopeptidase [Alcaligenaceae bacterium CGII-47]|nr:M48 family metallopeptidase [Alcaligenaceae bacterium CGII-47]